MLKDAVEPRGPCACKRPGLLPITRHPDAARTHPHDAFSTQQKSGLAAATLSSLPALLIGGSFIISIAVVIRRACDGSRRSDRARRDASRDTDGARTVSGPVIGARPVAFVIIAVIMTARR